MLVVELDERAGGRRRAELAGEILDAVAALADGRRVERVLFHDALPVDPRHNAKIDRSALARWAQEQLP
jgi:olefin beta-lactone synthetase